ncbi:MAG: ATP-binding cassette domain-containing protein [Sphingobacteriales bacterium]|nr:MAG: ATP-binding cassette domain-containing protein [Sphingobacteriales bacterium]
MARPGRRVEDDLPKAKITRESLREGLILFRYLRPYKGTFILALGAILLSALTTMAFPYLLKELIESAQVQPSGKLGFLHSMGPSGIAWLMIGVLALQMIFSFARIVLFTTVGERAIADLRSDVYKRLLCVPLEFFATRRVGELSSRMASDVTQVQDSITSMLAELLRGILTLLIGFALLLYLSPVLTGMMLLVVPVIIVVALLFGKSIRKTSRQAQDQLADSGTVVQETLGGIATVKAFANEWYERRRYESVLQSAVALSIKNGKARGLFVSFMLFSVFGAVVLCVWYSTHLMVAGTLSFGALTAFVVYTAFVAGSMAGFADLYSQLQKTLGATQRIRELLREPTEPVLTEATAILPEYQLKGDVRFEDVHFSYPSRKDIEVLKGLSLNATAGQQIGIVGASGAGKSTLAALLLQFYKPDRGMLWFDAHRAADIPLAQLRGQMALVPQDVLLFGGSIRENIAYGFPAANTEQIETAARQANAHEFISRFPEGYETIVGERGVKLSGGQRQRIAIARALLRNPTILILDEATSALDSESEKLVQEALINLMQGRTSFVIAHRLSTIRNADQIVVLENGQIVASGTHEALMNLPESLYRKLVLLQQVEG